MATGYDYDYDPSEGENRPGYKDNPFETKQEKKEFVRKMQKSVREESKREEEDLEMEEINPDTRFTSTTKTDDVVDSRPPFESESESKINSRNILLMDKTTQKMGIEDKKVLLSSYPDAGGGSGRYLGIELGVIQNTKKRI